MQNKINDILRYYAIPPKGLSRENLELEIRFNIANIDMWKDIYQKLFSSVEVHSAIEESIIAITEKDTQTRDRKEMYFEKGVKKSEKYIRKKQLFKVRVSSDILDYRISLASEEKIPEFSMYNIKEIRLRLRSSLLIKEIQDWRADFTFVKLLNDQAQFQNIMKYKDKLFAKDKIIKTNNFIEYIENILKINTLIDSQITFELELEYIGKNNGQNYVYESLNKAIEFILKSVSSDFKNHDKYHEKLYNIAKLVFKNQDKADNNISNRFRSKYVLKQLVNQPINFSFKEYIDIIIPKIDQYYLSDKANGDRCLIWINDGKVIVLTSTDFVDITEFLSDSKFEFKYFVSDTILDAEIIGLDINNARFDKVYFFDILYLNGDKLTQKTMQERDDKLNLISSKTGKYIQKKILVRLSSIDDPDSNYKIQIKKIYERGSRLYPIDGLVFTPNFTDPENVRYNVPENYFDMVVYKWKPPEQMTIDFMVMKAPKELIGLKPYIPKENHEIYFLFCGIKYQTFKMLNMEHIRGYNKIFKDYKFSDNYFPIQFSPSINPYAYIYYHPIGFKLDDKTITENELHGHVVEFKYDCKGDILSKESLEKNKCFWIIERLRPDRDINIEKSIGYGNDFKTAESTYLSYQNPFTLDMLINPESKIGSSDTNIEGPYFKTQKLPMYKALTKFNAFVKAQLIRQLENSDWIIDLASGKGQDLFVYNGFNIKNGLFVEIDKEALNELNKRKYSFDKKEFYVFTPKPQKNMMVFSKNLDLRDDYEELIEEIKKDIPLPQKGVDGIVINLAIHYIIINKESLENFVNLVNSLLKPGGIFIFTCFDGNKIFKLLKNIEYGKSWDLYEDSILKYSVKKLYQNDSDKDIPFDNKISVIHPFSAGNYYEENLLNLNIVMDAFKDKGFIIRQNGSFGDWLLKFKKFNIKFYESLTKNDKLYSSLYSYCSLWKPI